jgi:hypothetical protein
VPHFREQRDDSNGLAAMVSAMTLLKLPSGN